MEKKSASGTILTLLLASMLILAISIQTVKAEEIIYIRADGSVDPPTAPMQRNGDVYTLTDDITGSIVVERNNTIVDGDSHTISTETGDAFTLSNINNVTVQNMRARARIDSYYPFCIRVTNSSSITISGNDLQVCAYAGEGPGVASAIYLSDSPHNTICGNNIWVGMSIGDAIDLYSSSFNNISENTISVYVGTGIRLSSSSFNNIFRNNLGAGEVSDCIDFDSSSFNNVSENYAYAGFNPMCFFGGSSNNTIFRNTCIGREGVIFNPSCDNNTIRGNSIEGQYGLTLYGTSSNNICENDIGGTDECISLWQASNNNISGNNIAGAQPPLEDEWPFYRGIKFSGSSNNNISGNNITDNGCGIWLESSSNNRFYHNNLIDNIQQAYIAASGYPNIWDYGYPSGGNYWSDYAGVDVKRGPNQDLAGSDGVGDAPYVIDGQNADHYPLMEPWSPFLTATVFVSPATLNMGSGIKWITVYIQVPVRFDPRNIDVSTILLNSTSKAEAEPTRIGDYNRDGTPDLMVKFKAANVKPLLHRGVNTLTITGTVSGIPFKGYTTIRVK